MKSNRDSKMPTRDNGTSLAERLIPQALTNAAVTFVDSLKINSISEKTRRGRRVVIKKRNGHSEQLADLANLYFRMSNIPLRFWRKIEDWKRWETECFQMLNDDRFRVHPSGAKMVCADKVPGEQRSEHSNRG